MTVTIAIDFETFGHNPAVNPAVALGCAAYTSDGYLVNTFNRNIQEYGVADRDTMNWWAGHPEAYEAIRVNQQPIDAVMRDFQDFVVSHSVTSNVVFLAYNSHYDMAFLTHLVYTHCPTWERPPLYCIELRDVITQNVTFNRKLSAKKYWNPSFTDDFNVDDSLAHTPLYDAMIQAHVYFKIRRDED
jgi:DNA polymerase III alpha subunit (gram-positive type)